MTPARTLWSGVAFGVLLGALAAFQQFKLPPVLPLMLELYGYERLVAGGFMSVYAAVGLVLSVHMAGLIGRHGMLPMLGVAILSQAVGVALTLAAPENAAMVLAGRGLEGIGYTILAIAGPVLANASATGRHLPIVFALTSAWVPFGQISSGLVAQPFVAAGDWRPVWWISLLVIAAMAVWSLARRHRLPAGRKGGLDPASDPRPDAGEALTLWLAALTFLLWSTQYMAFATWLPQFLVEVHGLDLGAAALGYLVPVAFLTVFVLGSAGIMRLGVPIPALLLSVLALQTVLWLFLPSAGPDLSGVLLVMLWAAGVGMTPPCLFGMPSAIMGPGRAGPHAFGILMAGRNLGVLAGPLSLPALLAFGGDWSQAGPLFSGLTFLAFLSAVLLALRLRRQGARR